MLVICISYELARVNKPNSKMQEIASYNIVVTDIQTRVDTVTCSLIEYRSYSFKLLTSSLHFTAMFNTQPACNIRLYSFLFVLLFPACFSLSLVLKL